jgi:uncharacterized coiled-coil protein SlyX
MLRLGLPLLAATALVSACASAKPASTGAHPARTSTPRRTQRPASSRDGDAASYAARDAAEQERRVGRLELRLLERDAQVEALSAQLEEARAEVVRAMAKLRTVASRAEAASGMAEAEVALQSLRSGAGSSAPEVAQGAALMRQSGAEFDRQNYGGALYLANQAKAVASMGRGRLTDGNRGGGGGSGAAPRPGETAFALPLRLKASGRGNVREGPGTGFAVSFAVDAGSPLTGLSYVDEWVRVSDDASGRSGWIARTLVGRP